MGWNWDAAPNVLLYQSRDKGVRELFQQIHHFSVISPSLMTWWRVGWSIHTRSRHAWGWFSRFLPTKLTQMKSRRVSCKPRIYIYINMGASVSCCIPSPNLRISKHCTQGAYESIRTGILEPRGTEPERNHLENDPRRNWIGVWVRNEPAMFFLPLFGVGLGHTSRFNPPLIAFISEHNFSGLNSTPHWYLSEHNFSGLNSDPRFNPPLIPFISEPHFSGLNWDPHPGSTPDWYLSSLNTTFRGWTKTRGSTPHWWLSSLHLTFRGWTGTHILVQPPTGTFLSTTFRGWTQTRGSTPHWYLSSLNLTFRGWTGTHILVQPLTGTFHLWTQLFGLNSDPRFNPPLMAFISEPHLPIAINMAYGGHTIHPSICSPRNKPWEYKPKPNRFLVHSLCANRNEPKRTKGLLCTPWATSVTVDVC